MYRATPSSHLLASLLAAVIASLLLTVPSYAGPANSFATADPAGAGFGIKVVDPLDSVTATVVGNAAQGKADLYLALTSDGDVGYDTDLSNDLLIFSNTASAGDTYELDLDWADIASGYQLLFRLDFTQNNQTVYTGDNGDGLGNAGDYRAAVEDEYNGSNTTLISFERSGNSLKFDDASYWFSNSTITESMQQFSMFNTPTTTNIPVSGTASLLLFGLGSLLLASGIRRWQ